MKVQGIMDRLRQKLKEDGRLPGFCHTLSTYYKDVYNLDDNAELDIQITQNYHVKIEFRLTWHGITSVSRYDADADRFFYRVDYDVFKQVLDKLMVTVHNKSIEASLDQCHPERHVWLPEKREITVCVTDEEPRRNLMAV